MCLYDIFSYECGCESQPPIFQLPCPQPRAGQRGFHPEVDRHRGLPLQSCRLFVVNRERITAGKCASHRYQAQIERKIKELKKEIKHLEEDIADYRDDIKQEEAKRARNQSRPGQSRGHGGRSPSGRPRSIGHSSR